MDIVLESVCYYFVENLSSVFITDIGLKFSLRPQSRYESDGVKSASQTGQQHSILGAKPNVKPGHWWQGRVSVGPAVLKQDPGMK